MGRFAGTPDTPATETANDEAPQVGGRFANAPAAGPEGFARPGILNKAKTAGGNVLGSLMSAIGAPQQIAFRVGSGLGAIAAGEGKQGLNELKEGALEAVTLGQRGGDEHLDFAEAATLPSLRGTTAQTKLPKGLNTGLTIGLDPTLATIGGKAGMAREAVEATGRVLGEEAAQAVAKGGIKALSEAEIATLKQGVRQGAEEVAATGGRRSLKEIAQGVSKPSTLTAEEGAERVVQHTTQGLEHISNRIPATAVGRFAETAPKAAADKVGSTKLVQSLAHNDFTTWIDDAVRPRAGIIRNYGEKVASEVKAAGGHRLAGVARVVGDTMAEAQSIVNKLETVGKRGVRLSAEDNKLLSAAMRGDVEAKAAVEGGRLSEVHNYMQEIQAKTNDNFRMAGEGSKANQPTLTGMVDPAKSSTTGEHGLQETLNEYFKSVHAVETKKYANELRNIKDPQSGEALITGLSGEVKEVPEGWVKLSSNWGTGAIAPESIAREIDRVGNLLESDKAVASMRRVVDQYDKFWKSAATSLPVGLAFTLRNARSNLFLNWLDGVHSIAPYREALKIQTTAGRVLRGEKFAERVASEGVDAVLRSELSAREYKVFRLAQDNRVLGSNYFNVDQAFNGVAKADRIKGVDEGLSNAAKTRREFGTQGQAFSKGREMNSTVEDNARLANFIHNIDKYGDAKRAAEHTHKFLFDYADLTKFEQGAVRKLIPFYTFMRKNVPLQIEQLLLQPGKVGTRAKIGQMATEPLSPGSPEYLSRQGSRRLPDVAASLIGQAGKQVAFTPDTPLTAAAGSLEPFANLVSSVPAILRGDDLKSLPQEVWRPLLSQLGGARGAPFKALASEAAIRDLFTGQELSPGDLRTRLARALIPLVGRFERLPKTDKESVEQFLLRQAGIKTQVVK